MKKVANLVAMEMNSLISNPKFGFQKKAEIEKCCSACGKDCRCDSKCKCRGTCDSSCVKCEKLESKSFQEIFGIILTSSDKLDSLGFEKAAQLLLKASDELMNEIKDQHSAEEGKMDKLNEVESDPELKKLLDEIKERRAEELGSSSDEETDDENEIEDRYVDFYNFRNPGPDLMPDPMAAELEMNDPFESFPHARRKEEFDLNEDAVESNRRLNLHELLG